MPLIDPTVYAENRRSSTVTQITEAKGDYNKLKSMLENRRTLVRVYREDGARETARVIETVDIELIEAALATFY